MHLYIRGTGNISPQRTAGQAPFLEGPLLEYTGTRLFCAEPDYASLIDVKLIRRMSRIIRMGVAAATECLQAAGLQQPDAIVTGTAYGCLDDTGHFITKMVANNEELLTPTAFIQSTHNTIGAQIGLMLQCNKYNNAFVHRGFSFESALQDAIMLLHEKDAEHVLVGGIDEITQISHTLLTRMGLYRRQPAFSLSLIRQSGKGTMAGEGATFFVLSSTPSATDLARLDGLAMVFRPENTTALLPKIESFLASHKLAISDIDLVITGRNGDRENDLIYDELEGNLFSKSLLMPYKNLCGEYPTSTAFALWMASQILRSGGLPSTLADPSYGQKKIKRILVYNHYQRIHHSFVLLSAC